MNDAATSQISDVSPLVLSHHLLNLAEHADRAGLARSALRLVRLAHSVCSERPVQPVSRPSGA